jgi:carboxymethylenebutenolidase
MVVGNLTASNIRYPINQESGEAYLAKPAGDGKRPGVVVIHHAPGWDEWIAEVCRKLAHHGFNAIAPHLFFRLGEGSPDDLAALARSVGGVSDDQVMSDVAACMKYLRSLPNANGKIGVMGFCAGGRYTFLAGCKFADVDALVDCYGGNVIVDDKSQITKLRPVEPITLADRLKAPLLGIFGNEDRNPSADQVNRTEKVLKSLNKNYEFHRYDAPHAFLTYHRTSYRIEQALDGWSKILPFLHKHLG